MKLLHFPYLALREILRQMRYGELFLFSLISKRATRIVQSVGWNKLETIEYHSFKEYITVTQLNGNRFHCTMMRIEQLGQQMGGVKQFKIHGLDAVCGFSRHYGLHIFYEDSFDDPIIEAVYNQMNLLFGKRAKYRLSSNGTHFLPTYIPSRESKLVLFEKDVEVIDEYYSKMPEQESIELHTSLILNRLNPLSKLYSARSLEIGSSEPKITENLLKFQGKHLFLEDARYVDFVLLLKQWKSNESFRKLESLEAKVQEFRDVVINVPSVTEQVDLKELPLFIENVVVSSKREGDFETSTYIVRDDGIIGYVLINTKRLIFSVKGFTEDQMLKKI